MAFRSSFLASKRGPIDEVELDYVSHFYVNGINAIVRRWIKRVFTERDEEIASIIAGRNLNPS